MTHDDTLMTDKRIQPPPLPPIDQRVTLDLEDASTREELETLKKGLQPRQEMSDPRQDIHQHHVFGSPAVMVVPDPADAPPPDRGLIARFHRWFYRRH